MVVPPRFHADLSRLLAGTGDLPARREEAPHVPIRHGGERVVRRNGFREQVQHGLVVPPRFVAPAGVGSYEAARGLRNGDGRELRRGVRERIELAALERLYERGESAGCRAAVGGSKRDRSAALRRRIVKTRVCPALVLFEPGARTDRVHACSVSCTRPVIRSSVVRRSACCRWCCRSSTVKNAAFVSRG